MKSWLGWAAVVFSVAVCRADLTISDVQKETGITRGFCVFPAISEIALIEAMAASSNWMVYAQDDDPGVVNALTDWGSSNGLLAKSLYLDLKDVSSVPLASRLADVVLAADVTDRDLTEANRSEWLRLVGWDRGVVMAGRSSGEGGGLTRKALERWVGTEPCARIVENATGLWAILPAVAPTNSVDWTHRYFSAHNNRYVPDYTLHPPFMTQWYGAPFYEGWWGSTVVAGNGRIFQIGQWRNANKGGTDLLKLKVRTLYNGTQLWERDLAKYPLDGYSGGYISSRSCIALNGSAVYLIESNGIRILEVETGSDLGFLPGPRPDGQVKWIGIDSGRLAILAGDPDDVYETYQFQVHLANPGGTSLCVYDLKNMNEPLWQAETEGSVDDRAIAMMGSNIYYYADETGAFCRQADTGALVWSNPSENVVALVDEVARAYRDGDMLYPLSKLIKKLPYEPTLMVQPGGLILAAIWKENSVCLDPYDGTFRWAKKQSEAKTQASRSYPSVMVEDSWYAKDEFDLKTGNKQSNRGLYVDVCSVSCMIPDHFVSAFGTIQNVSTGEKLSTYDTRPPCDIGTIIAEGMALGPAGECACNVDIHGHRVMTSAEMHVPHTAPPTDNRFEAFTNDLVIVEPLTTDRTDWPQYAHDAYRSAGTSVSVGNHQQILWSWNSPSDNNEAFPQYARWEGTPPVAADGYAWVGGKDGIVRCFRVSDGALQWSFPTAGKLFAAPAVWNGRIYIGSADGWLYCLEARTGRKLWRFRTAPAERRMLWYGQLVSTWPMVGGVVIHDDVLYTVAGYQDMNGLYAYALDPVTGDVIWQQYDAGSGGALGPAGAVGNLGNLAVGGGRLWLASGNYYPASFDLSDGSWTTSAANSDDTGYTHTVRRGSSIAVLNDEWVICGGGRLSTRQDVEEIKKQELGEGFNAIRADLYDQSMGEKDLLCIGAEINAKGMLAPAFDDSLLVFTKKESNRGLEHSVAAWNLSNILTNLSEQMSAMGDNPYREDEVYVTSIAEGRRYKPTVTPHGRDAAVPADALWGPLAAYSKTIAGNVLAADAVIVTRSVGTNWYVSGLSRESGAEQWTIELPTKPVHEGVAIDRSGAILCALENGDLVCVRGDGGGQ
jgi:outer membrane protein assembly factor BamB